MGRASRRASSHSQIIQKNGLAEGPLPSSTHLLCTELGNRPPMVHAQPCFWKSWALGSAKAMVMVMAVAAALLGTPDVGNKAAHGGGGAASLTASGAGRRLPGSAPLQLRELTYIWVSPGWPIEFWRRRSRIQRQPAPSGRPAGVRLTKAVLYCKLCPFLQVSCCHTGGLNERSWGCRWQPLAS